MNNLDNAYSGIINIMREQGTKYNAPALMLGEVINANPLLIKAGDIQLDKDNLYVADYLMPGYSREASLTGSISFSTSNVSGSTDTRTYTHSHDIASHSHSATECSIGGTSLSTDTQTHTHVHDITRLSVIADDLTADGTLELTNGGLKAGDMVAIQQLQGTNKFVVFCRLI